MTGAPLDNASFPWLSARTLEVGNAPVRALRLSYAGELGWELHAPMPHLPGVYDALWDAGRTHGIDNHGSFAMNAMRMEKMFKGAAELTNEVTLPEAGLMRFVELDKPGGFVGQEATRHSHRDAGRAWLCAYLVRVNE